MDHDIKIVSDLVQANDSKIVLLILSGLGGLPSGPNLLTELQQAHTPNLDAMARRSSCGLLTPLAPGFVPTASMAILSLLGYDPLLVQDRNADLPPITGLYRLSCCVITDYRDYPDKILQVGFSRLFSLAAIDVLPQAVSTALQSFELVLVHLTETEHASMSGDYYGKIKVLEKLDQYLPELLALKPDVLAVTGDRSVPTSLAAPTWHPVPLMIQSKFCRFDEARKFDEISCSRGSLGHLRSTQLMPLLLAHADRMRPVG